MSSNFIEDGKSVPRRNVAASQEYKTTGCPIGQAFGCKNATIATAMVTLTPGRNWMIIFPLSLPQFTAPFALETSSIRTPVAGDGIVNDRDQVKLRQAFFTPHQEVAYGFTPGA